MSTTTKASFIRFFPAQKSQGSAIYAQRDKESH